MFLKAPVNNISIKPIYLIQGGESWQTIDSLKKIYSNLSAGIKKYHFINMVQFVQFISSHATEIFNQDLFCSNQINKVLEINIGKGKFTKQQLEIVNNLIKNVTSLNNFMVILIADKLDRSILNAPWVAAVNNIGIVINTKMLSRIDMQEWSIKQLKLAKLQFSEDALTKFVTTYQHNLIAAEQIIYKLTLSFGDKTVNETIDLSKLLTIVSDGTNFSIFDLQKAINNNKTDQVVYILNCLKQQGEEKLLVLWALVKEIINNFAKKKDLITAKHSVGDLFKKAAVIDQAIKNISIVNGSNEAYIWELIIDLGISFKSC